MLFTKILFRALITFICLGSFAHAAESLEIKDAWSPEAPPVAKVMAGYMTIKNVSDHEIKIVSLKSKLFKKVEIHLMDMSGGMMRMIRQDNLSIKPHAQIKLTPGVLHMMLIDPKKPIKTGSVIPVTFILDNNEKITTRIPVKNETE